MRCDPEFLTQDNMRELEIDAANPITWSKLVLSNFTQISALENLLDQKLFSGRTFADLNQPGKPYVILNATDIGGGLTFALTPQRFDDICSAYNSLPISAGVAASAAFPVILSPVSLQDFSSSCAGALRNGEWFADDLSNPYTPLENLEQYRDARYTNDLRHGQDTFRNIDYLYLLDGGVADNLGTNSLRAALIEPYNEMGLLRAINEGQVKKLVVIVVNARSDPPNSLYVDNKTPGVVELD